MGTCTQAFICANSPTECWRCTRFIREDYFKTKRPLENWVFLINDKFKLDKLYDSEEHAELYRDRYCDYTDKCEIVKIGEIK